MTILGEGEGLASSSPLPTSPASLIHMSTGERIQIIQERIRELQKRWQDLKAEVTYLDRRKRTARRKKEG